MFSRRQTLQLGASLLTAGVLAPLGRAQQAETPKPIEKAIPSSGEKLPVIGMGTSGTFDAPADAGTLEQLSQVMAIFFAAAGKVIDSSPMYGQAEARVGDVLRSMPARPPLFAATKVWTEGREAGIAQMEESARRMGVERLDLIAVHNLVDWQVQLKTLKDWKAQGKVRYIGLTTSHGRNHQGMLEIMRNEPLDFVQFSYNMYNREAEQELLPTAQARGIATMINRPFERGQMFGRVGKQPLPAIAADLGCSSWGQFFLKFIAGHPAVTCIIPATSKPHHMLDNMGANTGPLPDEKQRAEMLRAFEALTA